MAEVGAPADTALLRLMQLVSPALPVGAFAYSQGQEYVVEAGWVHDEATACDWIASVLAQGTGRLDAPVLVRLYRAWAEEDHAALDYWTAFLAASRETREIAAEDRHVGAALARLLTDLGMADAAPWTARRDAALAVTFALAAVRWGIPVRQSVHGYLWTWAENQVAAAIKLVPLGQTAGQRLLGHCIDVIPGVAEQALALEDAAIGQTLPGMVAASCLHETQYSRLFRS